MSTTTGENMALSAALLMENYRRTGRTDTALRAWVDAGYCIDAPTLIAAGSHERDVFGDGPDDWLPMVTTVDRMSSNGEAQGLPTDAPCGAGLCVGGRVKLLESIYDDGDDHHPPGLIAQAGEVLIVKAVRGDVLAVAHEGNPGSFTIYPGEYEVWTRRE